MQGDTSFRFSGQHGLHINSVFSIQGLLLLPTYITLNMPAKFTSSIVTSFGFFSSNSTVKYKAPLLLTKYATKPSARRHILCCSESKGNPVKGNLKNNYNNTSRLMKRARQEVSTGEHKFQPTADCAFCEASGTTVWHPVCLAHVTLSNSFWQPGKDPQISHALECNVHSLQAFVLSIRSLDLYQEF